MDLVTGGVLALSIAGVVYLAVDSSGGIHYFKEKLVGRKPAMKDTGSFIPAPKKYPIYIKNDGGVRERYHGARAISQTKFMVVNKQGQNSYELSDDLLIPTPATIQQIRLGQLSDVVFEINKESTITRYRAELKAEREHKAEIIKENESLRQIVSNVRVEEARVKGKAMHSLGYERPKYDRNEHNKRNQNQEEREQQREDEVQSSI